MPQQEIIVPLIAQVTLIAWLVESTVTFIKSFRSPKEYVWYFVSIALSVLFALGFSLDAFSLVGLVGRYTWIGEIGTGFISARGANYIFDFFGHRTQERTEGE